jgi:hypothetical protein
MEDIRARLAQMAPGAASGNATITPATGAFVIN